MKKENEMPTREMHGKICLVTGATSGIGKATAHGLAQMGATVVMVSRNRAKGEAVQQEVQTKSGNHDVSVLHADLSSQQSVRELAETFRQEYAHLHVLINNAGLMRFSHSETVDGLDTVFAVNYFAPFLLTNLLLDILKRSVPARIINVSSQAQAATYIHMDHLLARKRYPMMQSYAQSKLDLTMFTYELARKLQGTGVTANCLHPGFVGSNFAQDNLGPVGNTLVKLVFRMGISSEEGAKTSLYLASSPDVEQVTGKYFVKSVPRRTAPVSYDESLQRQLWEESARVVKLSNEG
ncbi:MAG TPA: SDR family oxidoreductase [Ktedonobacteraceae bacterium]|nr:SDR family oxidoreductase [Ktedonobacteraceae bacterium]